ncbi:hypothetical protein LBMAG53_21270 [Planctomycetota bacterium]|nr:hypothetical protein LBMAG53_21270 [Planctomycetota bacterium]
MKIRPPPDLVHWVLNTLTDSWTYHVFGGQHVIDAIRMSPTGSVVCCLWHQSLPHVVGAHPRSLKIAALVSLSGDGAIIADHMHRIGIRTVRGSSARGAVRAVRELTECIDDGWLLAITVDGPKGPRKIPKSGAIELARRHGLPLVPIAARASREMFFRSWDRFRLPLPRAHIAMIYGKPICYPSAEPSADELESRRRELARQIGLLEDRADSLAGQTRGGPRR